eukprot:scaffold242965_cov28-Attheya_sp.AAC.1
MANNNNNNSKQKNNNSMDSPLLQKRQYHLLFLFSKVNRQKSCFRTVSASIGKYHHRDSQTWEEARTATEQDPSQRRSGLCVAKCVSPGSHFGI